MNHGRTDDTGKKLLLKAHSDCSRIRAQADAGCGRSVYRVRARNCADARIRANGYAVLCALGIQTYRSRRWRAQTLPKSRRFRFLETRAGRRRLLWICLPSASSKLHSRTHADERIRTHKHGYTCARLCSLARPRYTDLPQPASARADASKIEEVSIFGDARRPTPAAVGLFSERELEIA